MSLQKKEKNNLVVNTLQRGAKVDQPDESGRNALFYAAQNNHISTVEILIAKGANAESPCMVKYYYNTSKINISALYIACLLEHYNIVDILLNKIKNAQNIHPEKSVTPIHILASNSQISRMESLILKGVNNNIQDENGLTPQERMNKIKLYRSDNFKEFFPFNKKTEIKSSYEDRAKIAKQHKTTNSILDDKKLILTDEEFIRITGIDDFFEFVGHE